MIGRVFGRLIVVERTAVSWKWKCRCRCGNRTIVTSYALESGKTTSCGCYRLEQMRVRNRTHGMRRTPLYDVWSAMVQRCTNPNNKQYKDYGERGITVTSEWLDFEAFARDMGPRPPGGILDRENNDLGYSKINCRWVTRQVSNENRRNVARVEYRGRKYTLPELGRLLGVSTRTMQRRYREDPRRLFDAGRKP